VKSICVLAVVLSLVLSSASQALGPGREDDFGAAESLGVDSTGPLGHERTTHGGLAGKRPGMPFTKSGKSVVKQKNAAKNDGTNRCENCGNETVPAQQHKKGVTPPNNETQVDHVIPKAKGGDGEPENGQVLCRECNIEKSDKGP
jgi:hypothetical protein